MYLLNLALSVWLLPFLASLLVPLMKRELAFYLLATYSIIGTIFIISSTFFGITFQNNGFDIINIYFFFFSIYGWVVLLSKSTIHKYLSLFLSSVPVLCIYLAAFGPSESCGQDYPVQTWRFKDNYKITHTGFPYGGMDYGSRFVVYKTALGFEKIIGKAENANRFYGNYCSLDLIQQNGGIIIQYPDIFNKSINTDTLSYLNQ